MRKRFEGIDYDFRPASYWEVGDDTLRELLANVKGTQRRKMIQEYWESGAIDLLERELKAPSLDEETRNRLGAIHPSFMGGEYLPDYRKGEVEIARVELQSTTSDVVSIRARRGPKSGRIRYAIVDEYEQEFVFSPQSSARPLTLGDLVDLIDGASPGEDFEWAGGLGLSYNEMNYESTDDAEDLRHFATLTSGFYPELEVHYNHCHEGWVRSKAAAAAGRCPVEADAWAK